MISQRRIFATIFFCTLGLAAIWFLWQPDSVIWTTFCFGAISASLATPIGISLALIEKSFNRIWIRWLLALIIAQVMIPLHIHVAVWDAALGKLGWARFWNPEDLTAVLPRFWLAVTIQSLASISWATLLATVGARVLGSQSEQQAILDTGPWSVLVRITLRKWLAPGLIIFIWLFVWANRQIAVTDIYQIGTISEIIYLEYSGGVFSNLSPTTFMEGDSSAKGSRVPTYCLLSILSVFAIFGWVMSKGSAAEPEGPDQPFRMLDRPALGLLAGCWYLVISSLLLIVPIFNLSLRAGLKTTQIEGSPVTRFRWGHFFETLTQVPSNYSEEIYWSATIGLATAAVTLMPILSFAIFSRGKPVALVVAIGLIALSVSVPNPLIGNTVARWFSQTNIDWIQTLYQRTILGPALATCLVAFGPGLALAIYLIGRVSRQTLEAGQLDGSGRQQSLLIQFLGQQGKGMLIIFLVCFLIGFGDLSTSFIPMPAGIDTLGRCLLGQMHAGVNDRTAALSLVTLVISGTISLIVSLAMQNSLRKSRPG